MTRGLPALLAALFLVLASSAAAQTTPPGPKKPPRSPFELDGGITFTRGAPLGTTTGLLTQPDGTSLPLFAATNRRDAALGAEVRLGHVIAGRLWAEASGGWSRTTFETRVTSDFENAPLATATNAGSQYTVEGNAVFLITKSGRVEWFARGGGGWRRQVSDDRTLVADGRLATAGGGIKYWLSGRTAGRRLGLRIDAIVSARSGGLSIEGSRWRLSPALAASVAMHF